MSWSWQVKTYFAAAFIMVASMIFSIIISIITKTELRLDVFLIAFFVQIVMAYLINSGKNKWLSIIIPMIPVIIYELTIYPTKLALFTIAFVFFLNIIYTNKYNNIVSYEWYKSVLTVSIYVIFIFSAIAVFFNDQATISLYRYLIIYFILMVICLREALGYSYHIKKNRRLRLTNFALAVLCVLLTTESIYSLMKYIVLYIVNLLKIMFDKILGVLAIVLQKPFEAIYNFFNNIMVNEPEFHGGATVQKFESAKEMVKIDPNFSLIIVQCLKIILIVAIVLFIIKIIKKITVFDVDTEVEDYIEVTEDIEISSDKEKLKNINKFFRKKGDSREEIIYRYERFVTFGNKKGIFKKYMTPKQIENIVKLSTENTSDFKEATKIYNEAKFSAHIIHKESEKNIKDIIGKTTRKL